MEARVALKDLPEFCRKLIKNLHDRQLVLLNGPLGAGKTQLVKTLLAGLPGDGSRTPSRPAAESPTFSVINDYGGGIYHVDLYRLNSAADIESTGFWDLFKTPKGIIFIEWPERVPRAEFPPYWRVMDVHIAFTELEDTRNISVSATD